MGAEAEPVDYAEGDEGKAAEAKQQRAQGGKQAQGAVDSAQLVAECTDAKWLEVDEARGDGQLRQPTSSDGSVELGEVKPKVQRGP